MKLTSTFLFLCCTVICWAQQVPIIRTDGQVLQQAYQSRSVALLDSFFKRWQQNTPVINATEFTQLNDTVKQAYHVFSAFYKPLDIQAMGGSEFGNDIYTKVKYLIVQNKMDVYMADKVYYSAADSDAFAVGNINKIVKRASRRDSLLARTNGKLSSWALNIYGPGNRLTSHDSSKLIMKLTNFRPEIQAKGKQVLYLTGKFDTLLNAFLGSKHLPLGTGGIMNTARSVGESQKRQMFLDQLIKIWYGHWGGYWQLYSYPVASRITFDKNMEYARVNFRFIYEGGEAMLKNEDGSWRLLYAKRTWIE